LGNEQLVLEGIQASLRLAAPPVGVECRDVVRKHPRKNRIARIGSRGRKNRIVERFFDFGGSLDEGEQRAPLIEAETVDDDEENVLPLVQEGLQKLGDEVDGQGRPLRLAISPP